MDWCHIGDLLDVGRVVYGDALNLVVWVKANAEQGLLYRNQHELVGIFRVDKGVELAKTDVQRSGRSRSNVWRHTGGSTFQMRSRNDSNSHLSVKPVALVVDAIKDCTRRGEVVLDTFCGPGTTILAAERVGRRAFAVEMEPRLIDVAIRRWQEFTRKDAVHAVTGATFNEIVAKHIELTGAPGPTP
jgi:DNA modification methylase